MMKNLKRRGSGTQIEKDPPILLIFVAGCSTIQIAAEDLPILPLPATTQLEPVSATRTETGFLLSESEYNKTLENIQKLIAELKAIRKTIDLYNEWVAEQR